MGWFDDNHWAGEAYDFGFGYMCGGRDLDAYEFSRAAHRQPDGHYEPGTRKCSKCLKFKTKKDFNREEAAKPANKRICDECGPGLPSDIGCMKVAELKKELGSRRLSTAGARDDLIDRLKHDIARKERLEKRKVREGSGAPASQKRRKTSAPPADAAPCDASIETQDHTCSESKSSDEEEVMKLLARATKKGKQLEAAKYLWRCAQEGQTIDKIQRPISTAVLLATLAKFPGFDVVKFEADCHSELIKGDAGKHKPPEPKRAKVNNGSYRAAGA